MDDEQALSVEQQILLDLHSQENDDSILKTPA